MQANFNMATGCRIPEMHIDLIHRGIFEVFRGREKFGRWGVKAIIPARTNTACKHRRSGFCCIGTCIRAISGIQVAHRIAYQREGMRI